MQLDFDDTQRPADKEIAGIPVKIAEGLWRAALPMPFPLKWVNTYIAHFGSEWCLIDCGLNWRESRDALTLALRSLELDYSDLDAVYLTHAHPDHIGAIGKIAPKLRIDTPIYMLASELEYMYRVWGEDREKNAQMVIELHTKHGMTEDMAKFSGAGFLLLAQFIALAPRERLTPIYEGDVIHMGSESFLITAAPGHSPWHMVFSNDRFFFIGDHILERISPNVSYYPDTDPNPVQSHIDSLAKAAGLGHTGQMILPGHGAPFVKLEERAHELQESHLRRYASTLQAIAQSDKGLTGMETAHIIFRRRELEGTDAQLALGEALAHLERGRTLGEVSFREEDGVVYYVPR